MIKAEILSTGDEIRSGNIIDTNSAFIARELESLGVEVIRHSCVGDDLGQLTAVLKEIGERSDMAVVSGGLGPTNDDLTAEAAALAAKTELMLHEQALADIKAFFDSRNYHAASCNQKQAYFPRGAIILPNHRGTAPGFCLTIGKCEFYFLPGVPDEMICMFQQQVLPFIHQRYAGSLNRRKIINFSTFGAPESEISSKLAELPVLFPDIKIGICVRFPEIEVTVSSSESKDLSAKDEETEKAADWVRAQLQGLIFAEDGSRMEAVVGRLLMAKKQTLAVAESCTGGRIADLMTNIPGISASFLFSGITYSNAAKMNVLGVSAQTLEKYGAVHQETVKEMALGAKRLCGADYGLATSGIAGPDGGSAAKPVGTVCIALAFNDQIETRRYVFPFPDRLMNKTIFAVSALNLLRKKL